MISRGTVILCFLFQPWLKRLKSCLVGDTIRAYVGPKSKCYNVHKALLTQYEWFSKKIYYSDLKLASRRFINLPTVDPKVFELLISWLYRRTLNPISTADEDVAKEEVALYIYLYLKACDWNMLELQNALLDQIRVRPTCEYGFFPRKLINTIYNRTQPLSPLRSYVVDSFIHKGIEWNEEGDLEDPTDPEYTWTRKRALKVQLEAGNREFVLDCYEALFQLCAKSKIRDPDRKTGCVYHKHESGGKCAK